MQFLKIMGTALMFTLVSVATTNQSPTDDLKHDETERQVQQLNQPVTDIANSALLPRMRVDYRVEGRKYRKLTPEGIEVLAEDNGETEYQVQQLDHPVIDIVKSTPMGVDYTEKGRKYRKVTSGGIEVLALAERSRHDIEYHGEYRESNPLVDAMFKSAGGTVGGLKTKIIELADDLRYGAPDLANMEVEKYNGEYRKSNPLDDIIMSAGGNLAVLRDKIIEFADFLQENKNQMAPRDLHTCTEVVGNHEPIVLAAEQNAKKIEYITNYGYYKLHEVSEAFPSGQIPEKEIDDATRDIATTVLQLFSFRPSEASMIKEGEQIERRDAGCLRNEHDSVESELAEYGGNKVYKENPSDAESEELYRSHNKGTHKWLDGTIHPAWEEDPQGGPYYSWPSNVVFEIFKNELGNEMSHNIAVKVWEIVIADDVEKDRKAVEEKARKYQGGGKEERKVY